MGKTDKKYQLKKWVHVDWDVLESKAFESLNATGIRVLLRFLQKRGFGKVKVHGKKQVVYDNGGLSFTYTEALYLGISKSHFSFTLKKLHDVGFIDIEHQGGGLARDNSRYSISDRWREYGTSSFHFIEKRRVCRGGQDVRANMTRKNIGTESRT
ncbi:MAG: hypothetical protein WCW53_15540 [Syntrophales bacterium]